MGVFKNIVKFRDAIDVEAPGEWVAEPSEDGLLRAPYVEYWDVVHRLCEAVLAFCDDHPGFEDGDKPGAAAVKGLRLAVEREEACPGVLLGYLMNGSVLKWIDELRGLEK